MRKTLSTSLLAFALLPGLALATGQTTRVNVNSAGGQANNLGFGSGGGSLSADGRYVAFVSWADNLVAGDTNDAADVFVRDRLTGQTKRVSVDSAGQQSNSFGNPILGINAEISANGRYVVFSSAADNLVSEDTNGKLDVFVHDRQTGQTERVSVDSAGKQGNDFSGGAAISADGRYVVFDSRATNLVTGDTNGQPDVFIHDRQTGKTKRASVDDMGGEGNSGSGAGSISADGRYVVFSSHADNLVAGDTNLADDIFVHDRQTGQTIRVSVDSTGEQANWHSFWGSLSADGRYVTFSSGASNLVSGDTNGVGDAFVHDRKSGQTTRISVDSAGGQGNRESYSGLLSADGRYVTFTSSADNLVVGDTNGSTNGLLSGEDVFIHDQQTGKTTRVSISSAGIQGNNSSGGGHISADGRYIAFGSVASNLVAGDTNGTQDVFIRDYWSQAQIEADVSLALSGPASAVKRSDVIYKFTIINNGSVNAPNTTLTGVISSQGKLKSIVAGQGKCSRAAVPVCRLGTLIPGQRVTVTATVTINGATTINVTAQAGSKDGKPGNNAKSITTTIQ